MTTIDLDTYQYKQDPMDITDDDAIGLLADFQSIDAEFIDDGISEDEVEIISPITKKDERKNEEIPVVNTTSSSVASCNIPANCRDKCLLVKLVDCDKYPWYYSKYKYQILKRKHYEALKSARNIMRCFKNDLNPPVIIDLDDSNDSNDINVEKSTSNSDNSTKNEHEKVHGKDMKELTSKNINTHLINKTQNTNSAMVDLKKNKGLIGMKVQMMSDNNKIKENSKQTCLETSRKSKREGKKDIGNAYATDMSLDKSLENYCRSTNLILNSSNGSKPLNKVKNVKNVEKVNKKVTDLKCSLIINSPKILMSIKKIKHLDDDSRNKNLEKLKHLKTKEDKYERAVIKSQENEKRSEDYREPSNTCHNYKPMPKSKRDALENYNKNNMTKSTENQPNQSGTILMNKSNDDLSETILRVNQFTENGTKLPDASLDMIKKSSNTSNKTAASKKTLLKKKVVLEQAKVSNLKMIKSLRFFFSKSVPITDNNQNNVLHMTKGQSFIAKPTALGIETNQKINMSNGCHDSLWVKQNVNNNAIPPFTQSGKEQYKMNTEYTMPQSQMSATSESTSSSSCFINQNQEKERNNKTEEAKGKTSDNNLPKNYSNCRDYAKDNTLSELSVHTGTLAMQEPRKHVIPIPLVNKSQNCKAVFQNNNNFTRSDLTKNETTKAVSQPMLLLQQEIKSNSKHNDGSKPNTEEYILSDNIGQGFNLCNEIINKNHHMQPPIMRPPMVPMSSSTFIRPNMTNQANQISKPYENARFQRPPVLETVRPQPPLLPLPPQPFDARHRLNAPNYTPPRPMFSATKPVRQINSHSLRPPNYVSPPRSNFFQRSPWDNFNQQTGINYVQNNYAQPPPVYSPISNPVMQQGAPYMPPGTSDVQPNLVYWPFYSPSVPPPQRPPPPPYQNASANFGAASIIGNNLTGPVKKISIPSTFQNLSNEVESKEKIVKQETQDSTISTPSNTDTVTNNTNKHTNETEQNEIITTKLDMMRELENSVKNVESPSKSDAKISYQNAVPKKQFMSVQTSKPGPLSKKTTTKSEQARKGYSPPVLPIPTFQNLLSEIQYKVPNVRVFEISSSPSSTANNPFNCNTLYNSSPKTTEKSILQSKIKNKQGNRKSFDWNALREVDAEKIIPKNEVNKITSNNSIRLNTMQTNIPIVVPKLNEKNIKKNYRKTVPKNREYSKISIEEYKKRCLQLAKERKKRGRPQSKNEIMIKPE